MNSATASIELRIDPSELPSGLRQATSAVLGFKSTIQNAMAGLKLAPNAKHGLAGWMQHAGGFMGGNLAMRGVDQISAQVDEIMNFQEQMIRFGIATGTVGSNLQRVENTIKDVSEETGINKTKLLDAARAYADVAGASAYTDAKLRTMARTAQSSEADITQLGQVMYQLQKSMKVPDNELEDTLGGIINTSKEGAVHFREMSHEIAELAPQAARYGMIGRDGVNKLTAMMQVARSGFGSVSEMGTGITRVFSGITMHADKFEKAGVKIFNVGKDGTKTWRHFADIWVDILKNKTLGKDPFLLRKTFGRSEADRTMRMWMDNIDKMQEFEQAGWKSQVVMRDLDTYTSSSAGRMSIAMQKLKNSVAEAFTPERINRFVVALEGAAHKASTITSVLGGVADAVSWIGDQGKAIRGWASADAKFLIPDEKQKETYSKTFGITNQEDLLVTMQNDYQRAQAFKKTIGSLLDKDEGVTEQSDILAVKTMLSAKPGSFLADAAESYLHESAMPSARVKQLRDQIETQWALDDSLKQFKAALDEIVANQYGQQFGRIAAAMSYQPGGLFDSSAFDMYMMGKAYNYKSGTMNDYQQVGAYRKQVEEVLGPAVARQVLMQSRRIENPMTLEIDGQSVGRAVKQIENIQVRKTRKGR